MNGGWNARFGFDRLVDRSIGRPVDRSTWGGRGLFPSSNPYHINVTKYTTQQPLKTGATPATIAILDGKLCVGLGPAELKTLARVGTKAAKCSRRDIPVSFLKEI